MIRPKNIHLSWDHYFDNVLRIVAVRVENHPDWLPHDHEFVEVVVVVGGSCLQETALGKQALQRGDVSIFRPGAWHAYSECKDLTLYDCCFFPGILGRELGWMIDEPLLGRLLWNIPLSPAQHGTVLLRLPAAALRRGQRILSGLVAASSAKKVDFPFQLGLLIQLLTTLAQHLPAETKSKPPKTNPSVIAALKLIDDHPEHDWTLDDLAARVHVLPDYLTRAFGKVAGLPPMAYLQRRRLEMATGLLKHSEHTIGEVGNLVGWPDANYFTRRFRAEFGLTPTTYRKRFAQVANALGVDPSKRNHRVE